MLIILIVIIVGIAGYLFLTKRQTTLTNTSTADSKNYSTGPFAECVGCENGQTWNNKPCCTDSFDKNCAAKNGVVRETDLHPVSTWLKGCFQKAPDAGKKCASATDCLSKVCILESAIKSNKCQLIKKEFTGEENRFNKNQKFYTATYSCNTTEPGECAEAVLDSLNPGGASHYFKMDNQTLIETLGSGPIY